MFCLTLFNEMNRLHHPDYHSWYDIEHVWIHLDSNHLYSFRIDCSSADELFHAVGMQLELQLNHTPNWAVRLAAPMHLAAHDEATVVDGLGFLLSFRLRLDQLLGAGIGKHSSFDI